MFHCTFYRDSLTETWRVTDGVQVAIPCALKAIYVLFAFLHGPGYTVCKRPEGQKDSQDRIDFWFGPPRGSGPDPLVGRK